MKIEKLLHEMNQIEMPEDMKKRIIHNCMSQVEMKNKNHLYVEKEKNVMRKRNRMFKKPMVAAASMAICFCLVGVTALASGGKLEGFFKDIVRWDGAVVGTSYEQATEEISISVTSEAEGLRVTVEMLEPDTAPYAFLEHFAINAYEIMDENGKAVIKGESTEAVEIVNGKVELVLPTAELSGGNYKLVIHEFVGSKKAEQPLVLSGTWECEFIR